MKSVQIGKRLQKWVLSILLPAFAFTGSPIQANPSGGVVVHGIADIAAISGSQLNINQQSNAVIINWQDFSIQNGEVTQFLQPANGMALNRVVSGNISQIYGQLKGNANVFVINPNGIFIGASGVIDVGGNAYLSTLDIDDDDFLNGGNNRFYGDSTTGVTNFGTISSAGGDVILMGGFVDNQGQIGAMNGVIALGSGGDILVNEGTAGATISIRGASDYKGTGVTNNGTITGAAAELKAHGNVYALAINNSGTIRASGATRANGRVLLTARGATSNINLGSTSDISSKVGANGGAIAISSETGDVRVAGKVDASGRIGGTVSVTGKNVTQTDTSVIDVSGAESGGTAVLDASQTMAVNGVVTANGAQSAGGETTITGRSVVIADQARISVDGATSGGLLRIGGDFQGRDTGLREADSLRVEQGASLSANSELGDAGTVIAWANGDTIFRGDVSAAARGAVGNGGLIEVSGKQYLYFDGSVLANSQNGESGTVLFDPGNVIIGATGTGLPPLVSPVSISAISVASINQTLQAGANVLVVTDSGSILINDLGGGGDQTGGVTANDRDSSIQWTNSLSSFGAFASGSIIVNTHIRTSGAGSINLLAGWGGSETDVALSFAPQAAWDFYVGNGDFGRSGGTVFIGSSSMARHVEVGSRFGDTNVAGFDVRVVGADSDSAFRYAQIGFHDAGVTIAPRLNRGGNIILDLTKDVQPTASSWYLSDGLNFAAAASNRDAAGVADPIVAITGQYEVDKDGDGIMDGVRGVNSSGVLNDTFIPYQSHFNSSTNGNWWWQQIEDSGNTGKFGPRDPLGLGGLRPEYGAGIGSLSVAAKALVAIEKGANINVIATGNVLVQSGAGREGNGAMIGHGGLNHSSWGASGLSSRATGGDTVGAANFSIDGGIENNQIERRWTFNGAESDRTANAIARLAPVYGNVNVFAGVDSTKAVTISRPAGTMAASFKNSGNVIVRGAQAFDLGTPSTYANAQVGHGGVGQFGEFYGDIHVEAGGNVEVSAGEATYASASIGHTLMGYASWNPTSVADAQVRFFATTGDFDNPNIARGELFSGRVTTGFDPNIDPAKNLRYTLAEYTITGAPGALTATPTPGTTGNYVPVVDATTGALTGKYRNVNDGNSLIDFNPLQYSRGTSGAGTSSQGLNSLAPLTLAPVSTAGIVVAALDGSVVKGLHGNIKVIAHTGDISVTGYSTVDVNARAPRDNRSAKIGHGGRSFAVAATGAGYYSNSFGTPSVTFNTSNQPDGREYQYFQMPNGDELVTGSRSNYGSSGAGANRSPVFMSITGDIEVQAGRNITVTGGNDAVDFAQIGHGGSELADYETSSFILGDIKVTAGGNISLTGGGASPSVNRGNAAASAEGDYDLRAWAQIGHGGYISGFMGFLGDIAVNAGGNIDVTGGAYSYSYAKIGHQGVNDRGQTGGDFIKNEHFRADSVESTIRTILTANSATVTYAAANGHASSVVGTRNFGLNGAGTLVGGALNTADVSVTAGGNVTVNHLQMGDRQPDARFDWLGAGLKDSAPYNADNQGLGVRTRNSFSQIGHGGFGMNAFNVANTATNYDDKIGDITVVAGGNVVVENGTGEQRWSRIGHGVSRNEGGNDSIDYGVSRSIDLAGNIRIKAGGDITINADKADENETENNTSAGFGAPAPSRYNPAAIGHGGVDNNLDLVVLGKGEDVNGIAASSNITAIAGGNLSVLAGKGVEASFAQLGHGFNSDQGNDASRRFGVPTGFAGDITVNVGGNALVLGGANAWSEQPDGLTDNTGRSVTGAFAAIGHGGYQLDAPSSGNINVYVGNDLDIIAQRRTDPQTTLVGASPYSIQNPTPGTDSVASAFNFAKIGHFAVENGNRQGNYNDMVTNAGQTGDIVVVVGRDLSVRGGTTPNVDTQTIYGAFAQIGHGGPAMVGDLQGDITVLVKRDIAVLQGSDIGPGFITDSALNNYAMIGNGDYLMDTKYTPASLFRASAAGFRNGDIVVAAGGNANFVGSLIGHADPLVTAQPTNGKLQVAVSRLNPFFGGPGILTATESAVFSSGGFGRDHVEFFAPARSNNQMDATTRVNEKTATFQIAPANFAAPFVGANGVYAGRSDEIYLTPDLWWDEQALAAAADFPGGGVFPTDSVSGQGGALARVNTPGGIGNLSGMDAGSLGGSAPAYRNNNGVSGAGLYTIYYDAIQFVNNTFPERPGIPIIPSRPPVPTPFPAFDFSGLLFSDVYETSDRSEEMLEEYERRYREEGNIYYVFNPDTNKYSSYRVFGTEVFPEIGEVDAN